MYVADGDLKEQLEDSVPNLFSPYRPSPWLLNSHLMTVAGGKPQITDSVSSLVPVLRRFGGDCYERELLIVPDGGAVGLDWFADSNDEEKWKETTPIVIVMHGLTGFTYCLSLAVLTVFFRW